MQEQIQKKMKASDAPHKLKLLVTVVNQNKAEIFIDFLEQFEVNLQLQMHAAGTAGSDMLHYLGLEESEKRVIFSIVREDMVEKILHCLEDKFATIKNGKGIAFAVPLSSVIGVNLYQFLSNNRQGRE